MAEEVKNNEAQEAANAASEQNVNETEANTGSNQAEENAAPAAENNEPDYHAQLIDIIRGTLPEGEEYNGSDDKDFSKRLYDHINGLSEKGKRWDDISKSTSELSQKDPETLMIVLDVLDGTPLPAAVRKYKGDQAFSIKEGDDGWEEYEKAGKERAEEQAANLKKANELLENSKNSKATIEKFFADNQMDDETRKKFEDFMLADVEKIANGIYDEDILNRYLHAFNYEHDIEGAKEAGKAEAQNKQIELQRKQMKGSGIPGNDSGNGSTNTEVEEKKPKSKEDATAEWLSQFRHR